jgi:hypothetical protein
VAGLDPVVGPGRVIEWRGKERFVVLNAGIPDPERAEQDEEETEK